MDVTRDNPPEGPAPAGPYSQVARVDLGEGTLLFLAGQVALDQEGNVVAPGDMAAQADHIFGGIETLLGAHGATMADIISIRAFLTDMDGRADYAEMVRKYLSQAPPTSTTVEVSKLALPEAVIEIEAVAAVPG